MVRKSKLVICGLLPVLSLLASCKSNPSSSYQPSSNSSTSKPTSHSYLVQYRGQEVVSNSSLEIYVNETTAMLCAYYTDGSVADVTYESSDASVLTVDPNSGYLTALKPGNATITVKNDQDSGDPDKKFNFTAVASTVQSGARSYATASYEEKANILGVLEDYAVDNYLTGLTMFSNGGYVVYNGRYTPTPNNYVSGYGWGTMKEGVLKANSTSNIGNKSYYHSGMITLFAHANAMDASGSDVSDLANYTTASYYSTRLNATNDGYEWYPSLATCKAPIPVDEQGNTIEATSNTLNRRWRIYVRTGDLAPVYKTASTLDNIRPYNNRRVVLEDYLTPFKFMLTNANGQYRGSELTDGVSGITDAVTYFNSTSSVAGNELCDEQKWNDIMGNSNDPQKLNSEGKRGSLITGTDSTGDYIEFNLLSPCTQFYAMYYLSSSLYSPLPMDFIKEWGPNGLGKSPNGSSPVNTMLYVGPYYVTAWSSSIISLKRNDDFYEYKEGYILNDGATPRSPYQIPGFDFIACQDATQTKTRFEAGILDAYALDKDSLEAYSGTSGTTSGGVSWYKKQTLGDSTFKLNVNSLTQEEWDRRFGLNGTVQPHTTSELYTVKPYMSNKNFLDFLSFSLDRQSISQARGTIPTQDYFSDNYLIDPENGVSYNSTDAHKAVLADRYNSTYGYNVDAAKDALRRAIRGEGGLAYMAKEGLLKAKYSGRPNAGTRENPWLITVTMNWMNTDDTTTYSDVFTSIEQVFSQLVGEEFAGCYELFIDQKAGTGNYNDVYDLMKEGRFDLGFGAISGNDLNPINFMEVLKGDNSSGFTLNWGPDTSKRSDSIVYDGQTWSFDGLWQAADTVAAIDGGEVAEAENISSGPLIPGSSQKYQTISGSSIDDGEANYRLSLASLIRGGANRDSIRISINNGSVSQTFTLDELNVDENDQFDLKVGADFNQSTTANEESGELETINTPTVTVKATYDIVVNGMEYESSSSMTLYTWYGIHSAK